MKNHTSDHGINDLCWRTSLTKPTPTVDAPTAPPKKIGRTILTSDLRRDEC